MAGRHRPGSLVPQAQGFTGAAGGAVGYGGDVLSDRWITMAEAVRACRPTDQKGQELQWTVRRSGTSSVRYRRAMMLPAFPWAGGPSPVCPSLTTSAPFSTRRAGTER